MNYLPSYTRVAFVELTLVLPQEDFTREMLHRIRAAEASELPGVKIDGGKDSTRDVSLCLVNLQMVPSFLGRLNTC